MVVVGTVIAALHVRFAVRSLRGPSSVHVV